MSTVHYTHTDLEAFLTIIRYIIIMSIKVTNLSQLSVKVRSVPEQWSIWPKHDKSIF